jgi:hypothetical protein
VLAEAGAGARALLADGRQELARHGHRGGPFSATVATAAGRLVLQSIGGGPRSRGQLLLRPEADWSSFAQLILAQANSLLSITVEKPDAVVSAERAGRPGQRAGTCAGSGSCRPTRCCSRRTAGRRSRWSPGRPWNR